MTALKNFLNTRKSEIKKQLVYASDCCDNKGEAALEGALDEIYVIESFLTDPQEIPN